ncbi:MAG: class I mannose-6-phosphate isomerase [Pleomorphochaeta sp.]
MFLELEEMRVYKPFVGGKLLDELRGDLNSKESHYPERWICSTTESSDNSGLSVTKDGTLLKSYLPNSLDILVKLIDSCTRLMIQVHPDKKRAEKYFNYSSGKTECWYVLNTRVIDGVEPYVFVGFKEGITKEIWQDIFEKQDIEAMENALHKINVKKGDTFFIPSGVPHAMGSGVFFAEVQEPSDITLRTEYISPDNRKMSDFDLHHGTSFENMFNCFDYDGKSLTDTLLKYKVKTHNNIIIDTSKFSLEDIEFDGSFSFDPKSYAIAIIIEGDNKGCEYYFDEKHTFYGSSRILIFQGSNR